MHRDKRITLLHQLFFPDGTGKDAGVFLLGKGTFFLSKCDGCVKSPNLGHVQHTLSQHLEAVSAREHGVEGDSREQLRRGWDRPRNVDQFPDKQRAPKGTWRKPQTSGEQMKSRGCFPLENFRRKAL